MCLSTDQLMAQQEVQNSNSNAKQVLREERELLTEKDWNHFINTSVFGGGGVVEGGIGHPEHPMNQKDGINGSQSN